MGPGHPVTWVALIRSRLARWLAALGAVVLAVLAIRADAKRDARRDMEEEDREAANDIRDRVERDLPDRLRQYEGHGFRDEP